MLPFCALLRRSWQCWELIDEVFLKLAFGYVYAGALCTFLLFIEVRFGADVSTRVEV